VRKIRRDSASFKKLSRLRVVRDLSERMGLKIYSRRLLLLRMSIMCLMKKLKESIERSQMYLSTRASLGRNPNRLRIMRF